MKTRAKHLYNEKELLNHSGNQKKTWETLKSLLPSTDTSKKCLMDKTAIQPNYSKKRINLIISSALLGKI